MGRKPVSAWSGLQRKSASLRHGFEQLVRDFTQLAGSDNVDTISGSALAKTEIEDWKKILNSAAQTVEPANSEIERKASAALETLEERLSRTLRDAGLNVYGETALLVIDGIVHAEINTKRALARINGKVAT